MTTGVSCGDLGASIGLENDNDIFVWNVIFEGPTDTLYEVSNRKKEIEGLKSKSFTFLLGWVLQSATQIPQRLSQQSTRDEIHKQDVASKQ